MAVVINGNGAVTGLTALPDSAVATGSVIQVVYASTSTEASATTDTFIDSNLTATITPISTSSKVFVIINQQTAQFHPSGGSNAVYGGIKLIRTVSSSDTTLHNPCANTGPFEVGGTGQVTVRTNINILDSPSTTSAVTYKTQIAAYDSNRGPFEAQFDETGGSAIDGTSYITLMEIVG